MFIFGGISMIIISSLRFTLVQTLSVHEAIIDFYYLFLGIVISLSQLKTSQVTQNFRFLNYHWGKMLLSIFLSSMSFGSSSDDVQIQWVQYMVTIYFVIMAMMFLQLAICDRKRDEEQQRKDKIDMLCNSKLFRSDTPISG